MAKATNYYFDQLNKEHLKQAISKTFSNRNFVGDIEKNIEIAVEYCANFVIDSTGVVTDVETVKSTGHSTLDKEIEKVVRGMEKWTPEKSFQIEKGDTTHRRTCRTKFSLPVYFKDKKAIIDGINWDISR